MKVNVVILAILIVAALGFIYFVIKRNNKDRKDYEEELKNEDIKPEQHKKDKI